MGVTNMPEKANPLINLAAGGVSGAVAKTITAPLEKVKLAIQNQDSNPRVLSGEMKRYTGMVDCTKRHISNSVPARSGAETLPTAFVTCRPLPSTSCSRTPSRGCSRSTTRIPTLACLQPPKSPAVLLPEVLQTHWCTLSSMCVPSLAPTLARLRSTLVWRIVWRKLRRRVASSLSTMVFLHHLSASSSTEVQFGLQDIIKAFNPYQYDVTMVGIVSKFIVAQIAVSVSGIAAYPFDTVQRRLQIEASKPKAEQIYNGMGDCFAKILKNEGAGGFFKGAFANILRGTGAAITLVLYDEFMNFVNGAPKK